MTSERKKRLTAVLEKRQHDLTVVLENVFDPHNISAVMRTCDAVGIQDIYIVKTKLPQHKKFGKRSGSSAKKWLTVHEFDDIDDCFRELRKRFQKIYTTHLSSDAINLHQMDLTQSVAMVFGNEQKGVSDECRALADGNFIIPQVGIIQSLNISVACAVTVYEAFRQKLQAGHYTKPHLPNAYRQELIQSWDLQEEE